jgi:hypothetical protein
MKESTMHTQRTGIGLVLPMMGLLSGALLTGCPVYWGDGGDPCRAGRCECERSDDCGLGEICAGGTCVPGSTCGSDAECELGEICAAGACVTQDGCRTNGDCPTGAYCDQETAQCVSSPTCTGDAECTAPGFWCDFRSTCVPHGENECRSNGDCGATQLCIENVCQDVAQTCQLDRECPPGTACVNNECSRVCASDGDCLAGDRCIDSFCRATQDCNDSSSCNVGEHCVEARCLPDCAPTGMCTTGSYCADDQFCRPDWERTPFCSMDSDCNEGRVCRAGVCRTPCPAAPMTCSSIDSQFTDCRQEGADMLCVAPGDIVTPECRQASECGTGEDCVNGQCRAR